MAEKLEPNIPPALFSRQSSAMLGADLGTPAIAKALFKSEQPLGEGELLESANSLLRGSGRQPLDQTRLRNSLSLMEEIELISAEGSQVSLTPSGAWMSEVLSAPPTQK